MARPLWAPILPFHDSSGAVGRSWEDRVLPGARGSAGIVSTWQHERPERGSAPRPRGLLAAPRSGRRAALAHDAGERLLPDRLDSLEGHWGGGRGGGRGHTLGNSAVAVAGVLPAGAARGLLPWDGSWHRAPSSQAAGLGHVCASHPHVPALPGRLPICCSAGFSDSAMDLAEVV